MKLGQLQSAEILFSNHRRGLYCHQTNLKSMQYFQLKHTVTNKDEKTMDSNELYSFAICKCHRGRKCHSLFFWLEAFVLTK